MIHDDYILFDHAQASRYEFRRGDGESFPVPRIEYFVTPHGVVYLTHTEVPPELSGRGIAAAMVGAVLEELDRSGRRIVPVCPYIVAYLERHPEWQHLVAHKKKTVASSSMKQLSPKTV